MHPRDDEWREERGRIVGESLTYLCSRGSLGRLARRLAIEVAGRRRRSKLRGIPLS
jgi:hypothetical protein